MLARVYSYDAVGSFVAIPLGEAMVGPLTDAVGLRAALVVCGIVIIVATALALAHKQARGLRAVVSVDA